MIEKINGVPVVSLDELIAALRWRGLTEAEIEEQLAVIPPDARLRIDDTSQAD